MRTPDNNPLILKLERSGVLTSADRQHLTSLCLSPRTIGANTILVRRGAPPDKVPLILGGFACRYRLLPDDRRQIVGLLLPGDFCDLQAAALDRASHTTATLTECTVVWLSREAIDELTLSPTRISRAMWWATLVDLNIARTWLVNLGKRDAPHRLAHLLCELLARLRAVGHSEADACDVPLTQPQIGDLLGISAVHVNRALKTLRGEGYFRLSRRRLTVLDPAALRRYCGFDPEYLGIPGNGDAADD